MRVNLPTYLDKILQMTRFRHEFNNATIAKHSKFFILVTTTESDLTLLGFPSPTILIAGFVLSLHVHQARLAQERPILPLIIPAPIENIFGFGAPKTVLSPHSHSNRPHKRQRILDVGFNHTDLHQLCCGYLP